MSFAYDAKLEVLREEIASDCCAISFLSALIKCSGQLGIGANKEINVELYTELTEVYDIVNKIISQYYGAECRMEETEESTKTKNVRYKIILPSFITTQLLKDLGIMDVNEEGYMEVSNGIADFVIADDCCKRSYIRGAFVGCSTSNIKIKEYSNIEKNTSGYHLEFLFAFEKLAQDFIDLLSHFDIKAKMTVRKKNPIVYIKEYQVICDTLALVGANKSVMNLQNEAAIRELRNSINRQTNCMNANLSKTVGAAVKQLNAIKVIQDNVGLETLSDDLMELCLIRLANPDESLEVLRKLYSKEISKSGINHRLNKIIEIAEKIQKDKLQMRYF
ncbi:MAG: DNA-binding protein WhiA [Clostridiales bacterium]|nr:DNA-binding protein WhiA [Clostridiales bacterium]